jgi:hypothetical protein
MMALVHSVCLSVSGWKAVLRHGSIFQELYRYFQKYEANCGPRSETIVSGSTCRRKILERNSPARPSASIVVEQWAKCLSLVRQSTTTQIASKPLELGNPVIESMEISHQGCSGIGKGWRTPYSKWHEALARSQVWQFAMYRSTSLRRVGQK